ncbi:hypothetical protein O5O45_13375 [Hahella aquimaris]|uniref:hypothetical protein n=1 Tax=Hahella sp. HNIBRBA332 TaxID=3015983 RepID=UPI00273BB6E5|nr:hypothetical protein [Hahella sp. HNIBRBA332]WLQ16905.1 hypothetical protein O5O45_13375 [Hahella sp. HNIBRBA332]
MKIHNPNEFDLDPKTLRSLARGDMDPVRRAVEEHRSNTLPAAKEPPPTAKTPAKTQVAPKSDPRANKDLAKAKSNSAVTPAQGAPKAEQKKAEAAESEEDRKRRYRETVAQRNQLTQILRECEALEVMNYEVLAIKHYPQTIDVISARRRRDLWLLSCLLSFAVFLIGWQGGLNAWVAGIAFGFFVALSALAIPPLRRLVIKNAGYSELVRQRKELEFRAITHIRMLEGGNGLAYQCLMMSPYRKSLLDRRYRRLVTLSQQGQLIKAMRTVAAIRLYLQYLLEAQQAFEIAKNKYMEASAKIKTEFADLALSEA